jgi:hypothetical protein
MAADDRFSPTAPPLSQQRRICQSQLPFMILGSIDLAIKRSCDHEPATSAAASGPFLLAAACSKEQTAQSKVGEEAATPGQPVALARVFWSVPRQFTLENRRLPLALPQSSGKLRNSHVSLNPLSVSLLRLAI